MVDVVARDVFRRHRPAGAHQLTLAGQNRVQLRAQDRLGQAEVEDLGAAARGDDDVFGFEVAVQDAVGMRFREARGDLVAQAGDPQRIERAFGEDRIQSTTVDVLHHDAVAVAFLEDAVEVDDRGMVEARGGPRFAFEAFAIVLGILAVWANPLDRDPAVQTIVVGLEDLTHAAHAEALVDPIGPDLLNHAAILLPLRGRTRTGVPKTHVSNIDKHGRETRIATTPPVERWPPPGPKLQRPRSAARASRYATRQLPQKSQMGPLSKKTANKSSKRKTSRLGRSRQGLRSGSRIQRTLARDRRIFGGEVDLDPDQLGGNAENQPLRSCRHGCSTWRM